MASPIKRLRRGIGHKTEFCFPSGVRQDEPEPASKLQAVSILQFDRNATGTRMVGHSATSRSKARPARSLSSSRRSRNDCSRSSRAPAAAGNRLLLLASPAHVVHLSLSLTMGDARRQQSSPLRTPEEALEGSFDGLLLRFLVRLSLCLALTSCHNSRDTRAGCSPG